MNNVNETFSVINAVDDSVFSNADPPQISAALELLDPGRPRRFRQVVDRFHCPAPDLEGQIFEFPFG